MIKIAPQYSSSSSLSSSSDVNAVARRKRQESNAPWSQSGIIHGCVTEKSVKMSPRVCLVEHTIIPV